MSGGYWIRIPDSGLGRGFLAVIVSVVAAVVLVWLTAPETFRREVPSDLTGPAAAAPAAPLQEPSPPEKPEISTEPPLSIAAPSLLLQPGTPSISILIAMWPFPLPQERRQSLPLTVKPSVRRKMPKIQDTPGLPLPLNPVELTLLLERTAAPLTYGPTPRSVCYDFPVIIALGSAAEQICVTIREKR